MQLAACAGVTVTRRDLFLTGAAAAATSVVVQAAGASAAPAGGGGGGVVVAPAGSAPTQAGPLHAANPAWTTSDVIVEKLIAWGVPRVFGIPGDGIGPLIEAFRKRQDRIAFVQVRHEESAAFMAAAHAKYTGGLGVCVATTGPGAVHLLNGLYDAKCDGAPVLALTGYTYHDMVGTHHTQDVDTVTLFKDVALYDELVLGPAHAETITDIACRTAVTQHGVAHLTIPIDIQGQRIDQEKTSQQKGKSRAQSSFAPAYAQVPADEQLRAAAALLNAGKKTAILVGRGALGAGAEVEQLADLLGAPVAKALLGKGVISDDSPFTTRTTGHLGTLPSKHAVETCDTMLIIGSTMPWLEFYPQAGKAKIVQIDRDPTRIGLRTSVDVGIVGDCKLALQRLLPLLTKRADRSFLTEAQRGMKQWDATLTAMERDTRMPMRPQVVAGAIGRALADDALISFDCGSHTVFCARHVHMRGTQQLALAGNHTTMGPGLPYAIAAAFAYPGRQVVACVGDGGFTMLMAELLTAVKYKLPIVVVVFRNDWLAHVIYEQLDEGFGEFGLELQPLDFVKFAEACGALGIRCSKPSEVDAAIATALKAKRPVIVEAIVEAHERPAAPDKYKA